MRRSSQGLLEPPPPVAAARQPQRGPVRRRSFFWRYRRVWFLLGILAFTALAGAAWVLTQIPLPPEAPQAQTTILYDATGEQLATLHGVENRFPVSIDKVPPVVTAAVVAAEDRKFFIHGGIDPLGIARATWADIRRKGVHPGRVDDHPAVRQERLRRHRLHALAQDPGGRHLGQDRAQVRQEPDPRALPEHRVLRPGRLRHPGRVQGLLQQGRRPSSSLKESAYLAGLIRSPSAGDVADDPVEAHDLRFIVLSAMVDTKIITAEQANEVEAIPVGDYVVAQADPRLRGHHEGRGRRVLRGLRPAGADQALPRGPGAAGRHAGVHHPRPTAPSARPTTPSTACSTATTTRPAPWCRSTTRAGSWPWSAAGTGRRRR